MFTWRWGRAAFANTAHCVCTGGGMEEEDQERKKKLEAGKAKLAQFRQRKGQTDSQNATKKPKKKKSGSKHREQPEDAPEASLSQSDEAQPHSATSGAATTTEFTIMRTLPPGEIIKHDQTYTIEPESEISTTADDYSSEVIGDHILLRVNTTDLNLEEEFGVRETYSEHATRLEVMEDQLAGKQQEIEELNRELEEMRAAYGTEGLQQLQEFETAIKQRDDIITQLTTNLQQARKEKDEIMREFLELTEQSQKLKIQFQHLQAGETLRNTNHTSTATDLLHSKQQIFTYHQQLEEQESQIKHFKKEREDFQAQITSLQEKIKSLEQVYQSKFELTYEEKFHEKDLAVDNLKAALKDEETKSSQLKERLFVTDKSIEELNEQLTLKNREITELTEELNNSKQKERRSSDEIKQLMGAVEDLQKKHHKGTQFEADIVQRMELETQKKLEQLQAELDEMYGQQIVQMKQELIRQHTVEIEQLVSQHKAELDNVSKQTTKNITSEQIRVLNSTINELNLHLQTLKAERNKMKKDYSQQLETASSEKSKLQRQIEDLLEDLSFAREQIQRAKQSITEKESKLTEASSLHVTIEELKMQLALAAEFTKELESKHSAEVTNYKIKLDMLEREKDAVLGRMAESQEAELEKLRTSFLFSQEEELSKLREDLMREHRTNIENLKDNLEVQYKAQIDRVQQDMNQIINTMQSEKDSLITKQNHLMLEISKLKDLLESTNDSKCEEMMIQINELQKEIDSLRREEKEKGTIEQEAQKLQLRIELLENEVREKDVLNERIANLEMDNKLLKDENSILHLKLKNQNINNEVKSLAEVPTSENSDLKNEVEKLNAENIDLRKIENQLTEEIERQKNTFSFAEKNFEVNYQELREEYACLLKLKEQLEECKIKQQEKYEIKLHSLCEELAKIKSNSAVENIVFQDPKLDVRRVSQLAKADPFEGSEVIEKDTTELMEKLEIAQRDKEELSLKLSDLSAQLQLKENEINLLKDEVKLLCHERDHALSGRQKLEEIITVKKMSSRQDDQEYSAEKEVVMSNDDKSDISTAKEDFGNEMKVQKETIYLSDCSPSYLASQTSHLQPEKTNEWEDRESLLQNLHELTSKLESESALLLSTQKEKDQLQKELATLHQEQCDMRLQLEAQRISLTQIHLAHLELTKENLQREKEKGLCSLKDEMIEDQEQTIRELQDQHHQELQKCKELQDQHHQELKKCKLNQTGGEEGSCQVLTQLLLKTISDEHDQVNQCLNRMLLKPPEKEDEHKMCVSQDPACVEALQQHIKEMQSVHKHLTKLLNTFLKEHKRIGDLHSSLDKAKVLQHTKKEIDITSLRQILFTSQASSPKSSDVQETLIVTSTQSEEAEKLKIEFSQQRTQLEEKHSQEIEHLRCYFQQQLKEKEERFTTEIIHLQEHLQNVSETSLQFRELSESQSEMSLGLQEVDIFKTACGPNSDVLKINEAVQFEDKPIQKSSGLIYQQIQTLRQALCAKYVEEVDALRKQHETELVQVTEDLKKYINENDTLKQELTKAKQENLNGSYGERTLLPLGNKEESKHLDINRLLEERYRERIEEEIARVIVEMSIVFAQKTELARLATLKNGETERQQEDIEVLDMKEAADNEGSDNNNDECTRGDKNQQNIQSSEMEIHKALSYKVSECHTNSVDLVTPLSTEKDDALSLGHQEENRSVESHSEEKTVILKEDDYNQMVAMGAESAKFRQMYEERVEDMRQELVRLEQEHQQATENLRLSHMSQLERQMYDQEQLLSELHMLRAQLAENTLVISEHQASEREKMLIVELESLKQTYLETRVKPAINVQDNGTQTQLNQEGHVTETESEDLFSDGGHADGDGNEESKDALSSDSTSERYNLKKVNKRLLKILLEIVKTTGAVEETIGRHVIGLLDKSGRSPSITKVLVWSPEPEAPEAEHAVEIGTTVHPIAVEAGEEKDSSIWSGVTEESLDLPLQLTDVGLDLNPEDEVQMVNISTRLQAAVEKLLEAINETSNQLEHAKAAQTELVRESIKRKRETTDLLRCQEELQERLNEEAKAREHLALELSKAEGLLDGYTDERVFLEKQMQEKADLIRHLEQELQSTGNRLQEFEQERQQIQEERELLSRQKNALKAEAAPAEQRLVEAAVDAAPKEELLEETEKLLKEKIEVQRQAEKDSGDLHKHVKALETELEDQMNRYLELELEKNTDIEDLRQKNLALEKQLEKTRKFLDEQAVDREHERDVFQQEIQKLEQQLKMPQRHQPVNDHQSNEVEKLSNDLKEKTDKCSELLLCKEQLQRDVQERNEEIEKLECRIRELEQALLISADSLQKVEDRKQSIVLGVKGEMPLEAQLQVEREAIDRKEKEITNLEEQLEQFREELENKNEEVQQLHMQLEIQRKESATQLHELEQEIKGLKDELETLQQDAQDGISFKDHQFKHGKFDEILRRKDLEIDQLNDHIGRLQAQLEAATDNKEVEEKNEQIKDFKGQIKCLKSDQERIKKNSEEEIEKLNEVIEKLQLELANIEQKVSVDFASMTEGAESGKHQLESIMAEKELLMENTNLNDMEVTFVKAELEKTRAEVIWLTEELENMRKVQHSPVTEVELGSKYDGSVTSVLEKRCDDGQREVASAPLSAGQVSSSVEERLQSTIQNMEAELQQLKEVIGEKDLELLKYSEQLKMLKEQTQETEQLKKVIEKLQLQLSDKDGDIAVDAIRSREDAQSSKCHLETEMGEKAELVHKSGLGSTELSLAKAELEATNAELELLRKELKTLRTTSESSTLEKRNESNENRMVDTDSFSRENMEEELREKTAELLASQTLLASVQEAMQSSLHNMESKLQENQKNIEEKDSELHQYITEIELMKLQIQEKEQLHEVITSLQQELTDTKKKIFVDLDSRENVLESVTHLEEGLAEKSQKIDYNHGEESQTIAELENTKMELKILKEELENLKKENGNGCESNFIGNGTGDADKTTHIQKMEEMLRDKTAQLLANEALLASVQETMQSRIQNMESQLQVCQDVMNEKDKELLQYSSQTEVLKERIQEVEHLNGVIKTLQLSLAGVKQKVTVECASMTENPGKVIEDKLLQQKIEINGEDVIFAKTELEQTKAEMVLLKKELENLRETQENITENVTHESKKHNKMHNITSRSNEDDVKEALRETTAKLLANEALFTSAQENMQSTIQSLESQLQELQNVIKQKDMHLLQYSNEIVLLNEQVQEESDKHDQILSDMENTLREKVAAALVSEAQMKAIQVHTKLMQKTDTTCIVEEESKGTQTSITKPKEEEEAESKLSVLSLRLLQLEKQLSDLHEELQIEREHVRIANQQAAEKEIKLHELQHILESTKEGKNHVEDQSDTGVNATPQKHKEPSQSNEDLETEIQKIKAEAAATKEELCHARETAEKLKEELMVKETNVAHLEEDLIYVKQCLTQAEEKLASYIKMEEQAKQESSALDVPDSVEMQKQTPFDRKTSSSQTDKASSVNNSNQTPHIHLKDIGVQNELQAAQVSSTSDEVTEIMEQFTEKIGQMQDLHAAEILDMEARHISESDSLRREQYVAVRALTEECEALKEVIKALRAPAGGVIPESALSAPGQFTDATSSDASSDWSQETYVQNFESVPEGARSDDEVPTDLIPSKIKKLLRAVHQEGIQVLTLTEPSSPEKETKSFTVTQNPWLKERKCFLENISSLKDLIRNMQIHKESETSESSDFYDHAPDWRGELLKAIQDVFCKEQDILLAAFHTHLASLGTCDAATLVNQMQHTLEEQGMEQINALDCIQNAERRSMLLELKELRAQLISLQNEDAGSPSFHSQAEDVFSYRAQQDPPLQTPQIHLQPSSVKVKAEGFQELLISERLTEEVKNELAQTKMELESALKIQHRHFKELESLRMEVQLRTNELDGVNDALANEQKKTRELQWALEKEKAKIERNEERGKEELEDLKMLVEDQRLKNREISNLLEKESQMVKGLHERLDSRETAFDCELSQERSKVSELQAFLDAEKIRTTELVNAIESKRRLDVQIQSIGGSGEAGGHNQAEELLKELQSQLDSKHDRIMELVSEMESYKLECVQLRQSIEEERQRHQAVPKLDQAGPQQIEELKSKVVEDLQQKLREMTLEVERLRAAEKQMKETIHELQNNVQTSTKDCGIERTKPGQRAGEWDVTIDHARAIEQQQKAEDVTKESSTAPLSALNEDATDGGSSSIEQVRLRLQQVSAKLKQLAEKTKQRILFEDTDDVDFAWSQNSIQEVTSQLEQLAVQSLQESLVLPPGTSTNSLTEKLLTQNAELTGYVSRLTEEKNDLRNALLKMEEEACRHRIVGPSGDHSYRSSLDNVVNIDTLIATEREQWNREKLNLQKSLKQSEAELSKVRAELRNELKLRNLGRESENAALKRLYGKYLRSESFRKALVYQKKYLLLLLGGFQECEEATLALIARMGGQPTYTDLEVITNHSRAFTRFRSAVRVSIAISRMKFLVRRWQRVTSSSPGGINRNGFGLTAGNELRTDSPYLPAGGMELYGEQRHSSCRSRSGFDSPQSTVNSQQRFIAVSSDLSPCSHLQHYDPDRALTDYISRLEALQKRLGTVQSGSSSNNTTHYGIRR
ncbi:LOW QUALITY PROTEIN: A-kinase anchor protein 9 [Discoglossus pictus]